MPTSRHALFLSTAGFAGTVLSSRKSAHIPATWCNINEVAWQKALKKRPQNCCAFKHIQIFGHRDMLPHPDFSRWRTLLDVYMSWFNQSPLLSSFFTFKSHVEDMSANTLNNNSQYFVQKLCLRLRSVIKLVMTAMTTWSITSHLWESVRCKFCETLPVL